MKKEKKKESHKQELEHTLTKKEKKLLHQVIRERVSSAGSRFKSQTKKALLTALVAAFGFLIALSWREVITNYINTLTIFSPVQGDLVEAVIVTLIAVVGILIVTKFLSED